MYATSLPLGPILVKVQERWLTVVGTLLLVVGMITSSFASAITTLYITYGLISGLGAGIIHYCSNTIVVRKFSVEMCPLALTIANSGSAIGSLILPPILTVCIQQYDWKIAFIVLGGISSTGFFAAATFVSSNNNNNDDDSDNVEVRKTMIGILKNVKFMIFFVSNGIATTALFGPSTFLPDLMQDKGISSKETAVCIIVIGVGNLFGRLLCGAFASKFNNQVVWIFGISLLGYGVTSTAMILAKSLHIFMVLSVLVGLFSGGYFGLFTAVVSYYLGKKQLPIGYGMISATTGISLTAEMPLAGFVSDSYGNEDGSFVFGGCMMFFAAMMVFVNLVVDFRRRGTCARQTGDEKCNEQNEYTETTHL
ncbi:monocarboxylate transporter 12-like isoform X2 [Ruditapes philippinarum]|uniref:monocarboxylate transporter 12-like isoform X2 n=1 Tax=Ruditapes philippinarum TaxID=129788 RepID=UPI00295B0EE7|nr:monocarboxylate transporter 12-like isoform X2 [Ruditapes philippinarum]